MWLLGNTDHLPDAIRFGDDGFSLLLKHKLQSHIAWADITGIAAFKRDVFLGTQVCLAFRVARHSKYAFVTQDAAGWGVLVQALLSRFPECDSDWLRKVSEPTWESPWTVVWGKAPEPDG
jgi:hypothetical protein